MDVRVGIDHSDVRAVLAKVISSPAFTKSNQLTNFLRYVIEETLAGRGDRLKAYTIATSALGRDENFDPSLDPIVRVEAGRLRRALKNYYLNSGREDPVVIELPVGSYVPAFRSKSAPPQGGTLLRGLWYSAAVLLRENKGLLLLVVAVAIAISLFTHMLGLVIVKSIWPGF